MGETFVIREQLFLYNDECFVPQGWTRVVERFSDRQKALARERALTRSEFGSVAGSLHEWTFDDEDKERAVLAVAQKHFPEQLKRAQQRGGDSAYEVLSRLELPRRMSDEQKDELLAAIGQQFFGVFTFAAEPLFYKLEAGEGFFANDPCLEVPELGFPLVFHTKQEALEQACEHLRYSFDADVVPPGLTGSYEQLSDSPEALATLIADGVAGERVFARTANGIAVHDFHDESVWSQNLLALVSLLKKPPFLVRELNYDEACLLKASWSEEDVQD